MLSKRRSRVTPGSRSDARRLRMCCGRGIFASILPNAAGTHGHIKYYINFDGRFTLRYLAKACVRRVAYDF